MANARYIGVVQAVRGADAELDLIDAHIEQLLKLRLLFVLLVHHFFEFDSVLIIADEHIEVMLKNGRGLGERIIR